MSDSFVALTDDGPIWACNTSRPVNEAQSLHWFAPADHPEGSSVRLTVSHIEQVTHTHGTLLSQPHHMWGAEMGANDQGLVISCHGAFTRRPFSRPTWRHLAGPNDFEIPTEGSDILGQDLVRLALERTATRADAAQYLVEMVEQYGDNESPWRALPHLQKDAIYLIADREGAVVVETVGKRSVVEEVTGPARAISDGLSVGPFARAHRSRSMDVLTHAPRRRAMVEKAAAELREVSDAFAVLRMHGRFGWSPMTGSMTGPCVHAGGMMVAQQTAGSWVADLRGDPLHWVTGTAAPCTSLFRPVRVHEPLIEAFPVNSYDPDSIWWRHELHHRSMLPDLPTALGLIDPLRDAVEAEWVQQLPDTADAQRMVDELYEVWHELVLSSDLEEMRPLWLVHRWRQWDKEARIPSSASAWPVPDLRRV